MSLDAGRVGVRADQVDVHGRVTSPSFLNELLEDLPEWTDMPVWVNGTEEVLPSNTSVPVTSPILADIAYPDIRRDNQYFTYRESPTPVDGLAKIKSIKGNTLVWNQLASVVGEQTSANGLFDANTYIYSGHKYLMSVEATVSSGNMYLNIFYNDGTSHNYQVIGTTSGKQTLIFNCDYTAHGGPANTQGNFWFYAYNISSWKNLMLFDLTAMGIDTLTDAEILQWFADYFPLSYYSYNQGSLLSFNGNGIKTVGKNQIANIVRGFFSAGSSAISVDNDSESFVFYAIKGKTYVSSSAVTLNRNAIARCDTPNLVNGSPIYDVVNASRTWTATWTGWAVWYVYSSRNETVENSAQVEFGTTATAYEPYTSSTLSLPISTYFPTGMKSAGTVYDELTPTKAIVRLIKTTVDGTNKTASYYGVYQDHQLFYIDLFATTYADYSNMANLISNHYSTSAIVEMSDKCIRYQAVDNRPNIGRVYWTDDRYTSAEAMNTALQASPLEIISLAQTPVELPTLSLGD